MRKFFPILLFCLAATTLNAGVVIRKIYQGAYGVASGPPASNIRNFPLFPNTPTSKQVFTNFVASPENSGEGYGSFIRGYLQAPSTGLYKFYIQSDDFSELFLSADESSNNLQLMCFETGCCVPWTEDGTQASGEVHLEQGKFYYFEVYHVDAILGDNVQIGWRLPDGTHERPINARHVLPFPIDPNTNVPRETAPFIIDGAYHGTLVFGQPADQTVPVGNPATFSVAAEVSLPATFQWRRNGVPIPGANLTHYHIPAVAAEEVGDLFDVVITNSRGSITSRAATLNPGSPVLAFTFGNTNGVDVFFPAPIQAEALTNAANFTLTRGGSPVPIEGTVALTSKAVRLQADTREGHAYSLSFQNLKSPTGAALDFSPVRFVPFEGYLRRDYYLDIQGGAPADLTNHFKYLSATPDLSQWVRHFESPRHETDNGPLERFYGVQVHGYFTPPVSGEFVFWLSSDDQGIINLSTTDSPDLKRTIAHEPVWRGDRQYVLNSLTTGRIELEEGKKYYIEGLAKEHEGGDHLQVFIQFPDGIPPVPGTAPSGSAYFTSYGKNIGPVRLTSQPQNARVQEESGAEFSIAIDGALPWNIQWNLNGEPISGATNAFYELRPVTYADHHNARITATVKNRFSSVTSEEAVITVLKNTPDQPILEIQRQGEQFLLQWPEEAIGFTLEVTDNLTDANSWVPLFDSVSWNQYIVDNDSIKRFFRLTRL